MPVLTQDGLGLCVSKHAVHDYGRTLDALIGSMMN